jgi:putative SOS response-associated peptidase YedK
MCNDYGNHIPYSDYLAAFSQNRIRVKWPAAVPNLEPRDDIWPTDPGPVIRRLEDGTNEFAVLRWGFPPAKAQRSASYKFPIRGEALPGGPLSGSSIAFFRIHRDEVA